MQLPSINIDEVMDLETSNLSIIKKKLKFKNNYLKKYVNDNLIADGQKRPSDKKIFKYISKNHFIISY